MDNILRATIRCIEKKLEEERKIEAARAAGLPEPEREHNWPVHTKIISATASKKEVLTHLRDTMRVNEHQQFYRMVVVNRGEYEIYLHRAHHHFCFKRFFNEHTKSDRFVESNVREFIREWEKINGRNINLKVC